MSIDSSLMHRRFKVNVPSEACTKVEGLFSRMRKMGAGVTQSLTTRKSTEHRLNFPAFVGNVFFCFLVVAFSHAPNAK